MPQGKGTYGSKVGRPPKKKGSLLNDDREQYAEGTGDDDDDATVDVVPVGGTADERNIPSGGTVPEVVVRAEPTKNPNVLNQAAGAVVDVYKSTLPTEQIGKGLDYAQNSLLGRIPILKQGLGVLSKIVDKVDYVQDTVIDRVTDPVTRRNKNAEGGDVKDQMDGLAISVAPIAIEETHTMPDGTEMPGATHEEYEEQTMLPDEEMEEDYVDYVMEETLSNEDRNYLISALEQDDRLSQIFDQVVESATEFSGSGPIEGPGSEKSDSIPARLSDGEFVFTAKATEEIGSDNLMSMMNDAEAAAEQRQGVAYGGMIDEEDGAIPIQTRGSLAAQGNIPNVVKQSRQVEEEMLKSSPRRYYVPVSG